MRQAGTRRLADVGPASVIDRGRCFSGPAGPQDELATAGGSGRSLSTRRRASPPARQQPSVSAGAVMTKDFRGRLHALATILAALVVLVQPIDAASLKPGFTECSSRPASPIPTAMAFAPGRPAVRLPAGRAAARHRERRSCCRRRSSRSPSTRRASADCSASRSTRTSRATSTSTSTTPRPTPTFTTASAASRPTATSPSPAARSVLLDLPDAVGAPTTTAARCTSAPTASSTSPSATTPSARTPRRSPTCSARCCASTPTARSRPTTRSSADDGEQPGDLGARPAQPVHVRIPADDGPDVHQRRRPEHWEEINDGHGWRQLRLADDRRADDQPRLHTPLYAYQPRYRHVAGLRDHRRRVLHRA